MNPLKRLLSLTFNRALWFLLSATILVAGCDTLGEDSLDNQPEIELKAEPIVVSPQNSGIIDLNSLVSSSGGNYTFSITTQPHLGTLQAIDEFLLKYTPHDNVTEGEDSFIVSVFGTQNIVIAKDTVIIIIVPDSTQLPCGLYALDDHRLLEEDSAQLIIDVLSNDTACDIDPSLLVVSLLDQEVNDPLSVGASFGSTEVLSDKRIRYTPNSNFENQDRFMYKITKPANVPNVGDPEEISIATVYILKDVDCTMLPTAVADTFEIPFDDVVRVDSVTHDTIYHLGPFVLDVAGNDFWCSKDFPVLEVARHPGGWLVDSWDSPLVFEYHLPTNVGRWAGFFDSFRYRICAGGRCEEAEVVIIVSR